MPAPKLYAGTKLRELRGRLGLTQKAFAQRLGVSLPYLNQMENNNRPVSASVVQGLDREFDYDAAELTTGDEARLISDMREVLADPVFTAPAPQLADMQLAAANTPTLLRAFLDLHRAYRESHERLASLDDALGREEGRLQPSPWEEVRDFFHYCDNYIDAVDRAAERLARDAAAKGQSPAERGADLLRSMGVRLTHGTGGAVRTYDAAGQTLTLDGTAPPETQSFQLLVQVALLTRGELIDATLDLARFRTEESRAIARIGMANYFAGAALLPYEAFLATATELRHDVERLAARFGASLEQVAHRLSTLQRPGSRGLPMFFVRVDQAGTITKRHSATSLQFARFGGACPLWNVHRAFETPGQWLRQMAETPDGARYLCLAREIAKPAGAWGAPVRRYAIGLGWEIGHAGSLVYADDLDTARATAFEPIGISCRICERKGCHQRSVPPLERRLTADPNTRGILPYTVA